MVTAVKPLSSLLKKVYRKSYVYEHINEPYLPIEAFFECAWLSNHLVMLKYWHTLVSTKACYDQKNCPADLLYTHKMFCNLINAAWLIKQLAMQQSINLGKLSKEAQQQYLHKEALSLRDYPKHLDEAALLDPYRFIIQFFKANPLETLHQHLYEWLNEALSPFSFIDQPLVVRKTYKNLRKLIEACWLIHERDIKKHTQQLYQGSITFNNTKHLQSLIELIINTIPVDTIYSLNKDESAPDLMIILDKTCNKAYGEFEPIIEMVTLGFEQAVCTVHNYGHMKELINKGHLFYSVACKQENIVYQKSADALFIELNHQHLEWAKQEAQPLFETNMAKATSFYRGAQQYLQDEIHYMTIFMLQQACELTYRCLLKVLRGKDVKCHSPAVLRKYIKRYSPEIIGVFSSQEQEEVQYLNILEEAYIKSRYEQNYTIDLSLLQFLNEKVGVLQATAFEVFQHKMDFLEQACQ